MNCERCGYKLRPLFYSLACDFCDGKLNKQESKSSSVEGWIVYREEVSLSCEEYFFKTKEDAQRWMDIQSLHDSCSIKEVVSLMPVTFKITTGYVKGLNRATRLIMIYPYKEKHLCKNLENSAYLKEED